ncbi:MAG: ABC transporter ATP-binding protein [Lachnospiraceae bacterium]|jgi:ATP-binding cassette subfamily B protein|nr:ABC transporter ATP-binding protein [Lachnospiraceae bacterium]
MKTEKRKSFLSYYRPYLGLFLSDMFFACLGAAVTLVIPLIIRHITGTVIYYETKEAAETILRLALLMAGLVVLEFGCNYYIGYFGHIMGAKMERDMRHELFAHYQKLSFAFYDEQKIGQLMSRVTNDLFDISELWHHGPEDLIISLIRMAGSLVILLFINAPLALSAAALLPFMLFYAVFLNKKMKRAFRRNRERIADVNAQIEDSLSGIRVVKSFGNEDAEMEKFDVGNQRFLESKRNSYRYMGAYNAGLGAFATLMTVVVISVGALLLSRGELNPADLVAFLLMVGNFTDPIKRLVSFTEQFQNGMSGYGRFREILAVQPDIEDAPDAREIGQVKGEIRFEQVDFRYTSSKGDVLHHLDMEVRPGEYIALVGSSGVGKSTLCSLIPRFYEVSGGRITLDGTDIRGITLKSLRSNIGIVQQDVYLFAGTVYENICYGKKDASEEEVVAAAKAAGAHSFILELPDGYHTDIGQRGVKLSGGQKQRLSLARVFLKNPAILIFDEATSALDNESERMVQEALERLARGRTTFVIAHRLSTIRNAEKILVMTDDGIAEQGTHEELLRRDGIYAGFYKAANTG